jgi:hypothetical protein
MIAENPGTRSVIYVFHINQFEVAVMNKLPKTLGATAIAGAIAIPFTAAQAWGPWGGGGSWSNGRGNNGSGNGWGDGSGDMDFSMSGSGHGKGCIGSSLFNRSTCFHQ